MSPPQWRNEAPGALATPGGAVIGGRQIVIKMWDNFARSTALLAKVRVWFNNSTIYLDIPNNQILITRISLCSVKWTRARYVLIFT